MEIKKVKKRDFQCPCEIKVCCFTDRSKETSGGSEQLKELVVPGAMLLCHQYSLKMCKNRRASARTMYLYHSSNLSNPMEFNKETLKSSGCGTE